MGTTATDAAGPVFPALDQDDFAATMATLRLWSQIVGKVRLASTPWINHSWHVPFYVSARGLTTSLIPVVGAGFDMEFDFVARALVIRAADGREAAVPLEPGSVARFHDRVLAGLRKLDLPSTIHGAPNEAPVAVPFADDHEPRRYDPEAAVAFWRALIQIHRVLQDFRSAFLGKCSPVHFFWGSFDMAVTRFSGRAAPPHPGGVPNLPDAVAREAYSHEVSSAGFWPGDDSHPPSFYAYAWPAPEGFAAADVAPAEARFDEGLGEFVLAYDAVRLAADPDAALTAFLQSTYEAAADLADWDRDQLECRPGRPGRPRSV